MNEALYKNLLIKDIKEEYTGFKTLVFEEGHGIEYKSGQYLTLVKHHNGEEVRRSYSITSCPELNEPLSIGVKRVPNGYFSRQLVDHAKVGDEIITTGAGGFFTLPDDVQNYEQVFFFAAGSGITPVLSLIKSALQSHPHLKLFLAYSFSSFFNVAYTNELSDLAIKHVKRFGQLPLFSSNTDLYYAHLHRDLLLELYNAYKVHDDNKILFYTCGPESYMRLVTWTLQEHGVPSDQIRKENFVIHTAPKPATAPPDKVSRMAFIEYGGRKHDVRVDFPDSILKAAKKQGLVLPYSCEAGRCGNCVAKCISGKVWHSYNEVLTDKDLEKGLVLTCVGHPIQGDVELQIL